MEDIKLQAIPNQLITVTVDGYRYELEIKSTGDSMTCGITRDGTLIIENGFRIVNGEPLIPYKYMEKGNFILDMPDTENPDYSQLESTQFLRYASQAELEAIR